MIMSCTSNNRRNSNRFNNNGLNNNRLNNNGFNNNEFNNNEFSNNESNNNRFNNNEFSNNESDNTGFNNNEFSNTGFNNNGRNNRGQNRGPGFVDHIRGYIGENVTIFTTSGGASGYGFAGVLLSVNQSCLRLVTEQGIAPTNPLAENICGDMSDNSPDRGTGSSYYRGSSNQPNRVAGSVSDIPLNYIAAFCHNAV
jgi:hypothetical protein